MSKKEIVETLGILWAVDVKGPERTQPTKHADDFTGTQILIKNIELSFTLVYPREDIAQEESIPTHWRTLGEASPVLFVSNEFLALKRPMIDRHHHHHRGLFTTRSDPSGPPAENQISHRKTIESGVELHIALFHSVVGFRTMCNSEELH
jgi:hypothetical protein